MAASPFEIRRLKIQRAQFVQILTTKAREQIQQLRQRHVRAVALLGEPVERLEGTRLARFQDDLQPRHPVRSLAVNQVTDDVEDGPGAGAFVSMRPRFRQVVKQRLENCRRALEERHSVAHAIADA
jgi:hypothetical protein